MIDSRLENVWASSVEVVYFPHMDHPQKKAFFVELWQDDLRHFFLHLLGDGAKTLSILMLLYLFWEVLSWLRYRGYPDDLLRNLEKTHFAFMWIALSTTSTNFVIKQGVVLWRKDK
jgi:hypothetical protein